MKSKKFVSVFLIILILIVGMSLNSCTTNKNEIIESGGSLATVNLTLTVDDTIGLSKIVPVLKDQPTRAFIHTRADGTSNSISDDFLPTIPTKYIAYFVADEDKDSYKAGAIVKIISVHPGKNNITVPDIKYNVYVTNYNVKPLTGSVLTENDLTDIQENLPVASDSLCLSGDILGVNFDNSDKISDTISVSLQNLYAAVAVRKNTLTSGVTFAKDTSSPIPYILDANTNWYYLYIKCSTSGTTKTNSTISLSNCGSLTSYPLNEDILADHKYEFTINYKKGGGLYIDVSNIFKAAPITYIIDLNDLN